MPTDPSVLRVPAAVVAHLRDLSLLSHEVLAILGLSASGRLVCEVRVVGNAHGVRATPADFLGDLLRHKAKAFILAHNHPSGCVEPSAADLQFTRRARDAGRLCGVRLADHVILAGGRWLSFRDAGWLEDP